MRLVVASGKGGTGKTTVAVSMALSLSTSPAMAAPAASPVFLLDCDVEEPNANLFLKPEWELREDVAIAMPVIDEATCTGCGRCAEVCQYHALAVIGKKVLFFPEICHGCAGCTLICPEKAISEAGHVIGVVEEGRSGSLRFAHGRLRVSEPMAGPIIKRLRRTGQAGDIVIMDAPPGISCPLVQTLRGADFCLLVTEPTPFGLHDLRLAHNMCRQLGVPAGVVVNRDGIGDRGVDAYCQAEGLPILLRIPFDRRIASASAEGVPLVEALPESRQWFTGLFETISNLCR